MYVHLRSNHKKLDAFYTIFTHFFSASENCIFSQPVMRQNHAICFCYFNPFMSTVAFNICCPRDCVSRHNGGTAGVPLKPLRDDSALKTLLSLRVLRGAPEVPPLCRETQSLGQHMLNAPVGINGLKIDMYLLFLM